MFPVLSISWNDICLLTSHCCFTTGVSAWTKEQKPVKSIIFAPHCRYQLSATQRALLRDCKLDWIMQPQRISKIKLARLCVSRRDHGGFFIQNRRARVLSRPSAWRWWWWQWFVSDFMKTPFATTLFANGNLKLVQRMQIGASSANVTITLIYRPNVIPIGIFRSM